MHTCNNIELISVQSLLDWAKDLIACQEDLSYQSPSFEARLLFSFASDKSHTWIVSHASERVLEHLSDPQVECFTQVVNDRLRGKPIAFILGTQDFWSLSLKVSDCTLIPRQDTEVLVETVLQLVLPEKACVLDLGTGTGAIAIALAKEKPKWQVTGIDKVEQAVELARENSRLNAAPVQFLQSDWFEALKTQKEPLRFDVIVTNPPYVEQDSEYIKQGDLRFEPLSALVSGKDGLDDIRYIIKQSTQHLSNQGYLLIEHSDKQFENVQSLLCDAGFTDVKSVLDINQNHRVTLGKWWAK
jgi:release factor glutamine methyltransferase